MRTLTTLALAVTLGLAVPAFAETSAGESNGDARAAVKEQYEAHKDRRDARREEIKAKHEARKEHRQERIETVKEKRLEHIDKRQAHIAKAKENLAKREAHLNDAEQKLKASPAAGAPAAQ